MENVVLLPHVGSASDRDAPRHGHAGRRQHHLVVCRQGADHAGCRDAREEVIRARSPC